MWSLAHFSTVAASYKPAPSQGPQFRKLSQCASSPQEALCELTTAKEVSAEVNPLVMPRAWCSDCMVWVLRTPVTRTDTVARALLIPGNGYPDIQRGKEGCSRMFQIFRLSSAWRLPPLCPGMIPSCLGRALHSGNCAKPRLQASCPAGVIPAGLINIFTFEGIELLSPNPCPSLHQPWYPGNDRREPVSHFERKFR